MNKCWPHGAPHTFDKPCPQCEKEFDEKYPHLTKPEEPEATAAKPHRYNQGKIEYWDAVRDLGWDYFQATAGKYIHRYRDKNGPEDLVKSINFIIKMIANETGEDYYELRKLTPEELAKRVKK